MEPIITYRNYYEKIGWSQCYMHQIITLTSGVDLSPSEYSNHNIGVPYITGASNIDDKNNIIINRYTSTKYINSHRNEILLSCKGTIGKIVINDIGDIHVARQIMSIKSYILNEYLMIYLNTIASSLNANAKSMIPGIDRQQILTRTINLPPIEEQKRICIRIKTINKYLFD